MLMVAGDLHFSRRIDPSPPNDGPKGENLHISREIRPPPPTVLAGGGGWYCEIVLDVRAFLALRQYLAWRKAPRNHGCRYCYLILNHALCVKNQLVKRAGDC